jgi:hypothetical protein
MDPARDTAALASAGWVPGGHIKTTRDWPGFS